MLLTLFITQERLNFGEAKERLNNVEKKERIYPSISQNTYKNEKNKVAGRS